MREKLHIILCDRDVRRRASVSHFLSEMSLHAEPFEDPSEVHGFWSHADVVLVYDEGQSVRRVVDHLCNLGLVMPVIAFSESPSTHRVARAIQAGAFDYLSWPCGSEEVWDTISNAENNGASFYSFIRRETMARRQVARLTKREQEVLTGVAKGLSNRTIGEHLAISPRTVEIHRANMLVKMGANHTSEAIRIAVEASLVQ